MSLVDVDRQWFKAVRGLSGARETDRGVSICAHAIAVPGDIFVVSDLTADARLTDNPMVTMEPFIRFYAGAPLVTTAGVPLGTLCVVDGKPRRLTRRQYAALRTLARQVTRLIESQAAVR